MHRRPRTGILPVAAALLLAGLVAPATPASAVEAATVGRFVRLSDAFNARLSNSPVADLSAEARRDRAACILSRFEAEFGAGAIADLMGLMDVLSRGAEFDDPVIVAFDARYGPAYGRTETECTRQARGG